MTTPGDKGSDSFAVFLVPAVMVMTAVAVAPILYIVYFSFTIEGVFTLQGYASALSSLLLMRVFFGTVIISLSTAAVATLLAYPIALHLASMSATRRTLYLFFILLPFWTSILVKSFTFAVILGREGAINSAITYVFGQEATLPLLYNRFGVIVGLVNYVLPFVVLPLLANILSQDQNLRKAAQVMGANAWTVIWRVTIPLSMPAAATGALIATILAFGSFITPALLGGRRDAMLANLIELFTRETLNWNLASVIAVFLLVITGVLMSLVGRLRSSSSLGM